MFIKSVVFAVLALFSVSAFAVKDIQAPEYAFDFEAARVSHLLTTEACRAYGETVKRVSTNINDGYSNRQLREDLYKYISANKGNTNLLIAVTMLSHEDILDAVREYSSAKDYKEFARRFPNLSSNSLHGYTAEARCLAFVGIEVFTVKVVRKNKVVM